MRVRACVRVHAHRRAPECSARHASALLAIGGRERQREREREKKTERERGEREREGEIWKGAIERINRRDRELAS